VILGSTLLRKQTIQMKTRPFKHCLLMQQRLLNSKRIFIEIKQTKNSHQDLLCFFPFCFVLNADFSGFSKRSCFWNNGCGCRCALRSAKGPDELKPKLQ
jgi:hypothetical protein